MQVCQTRECDSPKGGAAWKHPARRLNYRPNGAARAMRDRRTRQVGVLLRNAPDRPMHNLTTFEMILGINQALDAEGYVVSLVRIGDVGEDEAHDSRVFREHLLDGLIVVDSLPERVYDRVEGLVPRVVWLESNRWREADSVRRDEPAAGRRAADEVARRGYRRAVYIGNHVRSPDTAGPVHYSVGERLAAVARGLAGHGLAMIPIDLQMHLSTVGAERALLEVASADTAVVAYSADVAQWVAMTLARHGRAAGQDYGLVCCDETFRDTRSWPGLARVGNDRLALGRTAGEMLLSLLVGGADECPSRRLAGEWVEGDTLPDLTAAPPDGHAPPEGPPTN